MSFRNQPVFLIDKGFYRVRVYDPYKGKDVTIDFGDSISPEITLGIIEKNPKYLKLQKTYLLQNSDIDDPLNPIFWERRYVWKSGDQYVIYQSPDNNDFYEPSFPAQNAIDPYTQTVIAPGFAYGAPYYTTYDYPYATTTTYYPYYSNRHSTGALVATGLAGLAVGALLL